MVKCGLVFNRHRWRRFADGSLQICVKCGECQHVLIEGAYVRCYGITFDEFQRLLKDFSRHVEPSERRALEFLRQLQKKEPDYKEQIKKRAEQSNGLRQQIHDEIRRPDLEQS